MTSSLSHKNDVSNKAQIIINQRHVWFKDYNIFWLNMWETRAWRQGIVLVHGPFHRLLVPWRYYD